MSQQISEIYIVVSRESGPGLGYWVYLAREDGGKMSPYMSYIMDRAIYYAAEWGSFLGLEPQKIEPNELLGLTPEMVEAGYKEAEFMVNTLDAKDWIRGF